MDLDQPAVPLRAALTGTAPRGGCTSLGQAAGTCAPAACPRLSSYLSVLARLPTAAAKRCSPQERLLTGLPSAHGIEGNGARFQVYLTAHQPMRPEGINREGVSQQLHR